MYFKSILAIAAYFSIVFVLAVPVSEMKDDFAGADVEDTDAVRVNRNGSGNGANSGNGGNGGSGGGSGGNGGIFGGNTGNRVSGDNNTASP
ncbi:hypothetical protein AB1N83_014056 [Pleurotus pulmonarius]